MSSHTWTLQTPLQFDQDTTWLWLHRSPGCFIALCNIVHHSSAGICRVFFWFTRRETGESHTQDLGVGVSCNLISTFKSWLRWCQMSPYTQILCVSLSPVSLQVKQKETLQIPAKHDARRYKTPRRPMQPLATTLSTGEMPERYCERFSSHLLHAPYIAWSRRYNLNDPILDHQPLKICSKITQNRGPVSGQCQIPPGPPSPGAARASLGRRQRRLPGALGPTRRAERDGLQATLVASCS